MKKLFVIIVIILFVSAGIFPAINADVCKATSEQLSYTPHDPIYIQGNDDFTSENGVTGGSGTSNDPYTIEDWKISAATKDGITIRNTNVFFEISNSYIYTGGISHDGIVFYNVTNGVIKENILTGNKNGIMFRTQDPPMKENSSLNKIFLNNIYDNAYDGIHFEHTIWDHHSDNKIFLNNITGNKRGIYLIMSQENLVFNNNVISNSEIGIELFMCMGGGSDNRVFHNNFINNGGENSQALCTCDCNDWDDGYPSGGNYWSDYKGEDSNGDGIGDEPYLIYSEYEEYDYDWYPMMEPFGNFEFPPYTKISFDPEYPDGENGWYISNVTVTLEAEDDIEVNATYYRINKGVWETYEFPFILSEDGSDILIEYYSIDIDGNEEDIKSAILDIDKTPPEINVTWEKVKIGWRKWEVTFIINVTDNINGGIFDRLEIYLNNGLFKVITGPGPEYVFSIIIQFRPKYSFKFVIRDMAGNQASAVVNSSDISVISKERSLVKQNLFKIIFEKIIDRFILLQHLLDIIGVNIK